MNKTIIVKVVWMEYKNHFKLMNGKVSGNVNWLMELRAESRAHTMYATARGMRVCPAPLPFIFHFFKSTFRRGQTISLFSGSHSTICVPMIFAVCGFTVPNTLSFSST